MCEFIREMIDTGQAVVTCETSSGTSTCLLLRQIPAFGIWIGLIAAEL